MMLNWRLIREVGADRWVWRTAVRQFFKRVLRRDQTMRLPSGECMQLPRSSRFASEVFVTQANVDWGSERLLFALLKRKGWFLDVGANIGYYSLYMYPRVTGVASFEPDPRARSLLEANLVGRPRALVVPKAAGRSAGQATFVLESSSEVSHIGGPETGDGATRSITVDVVALSEFVASQGIEVEAIKIDAEGHDFDVLEGASRLLTEQRPLVLTEASPTPALFRFVRDQDYGAMAFVRESHSRRVSFVRLSGSPVNPGETKMLLLAPSEAVAEVMIAGERIALGGGRPDPATTGRDVR